MNSSSESVTKTDEKSTSFWSFDKHGIVKSASIYIVSAWIILQVASIVVPALFLPDWWMTFTLYFLVAGFPAVIILAWLFDLTPRGLERDQSTNKNLRPRIGILLASIYVVVAGFLIYNYVSSNTALTGEQGVVTAETVASQRAEASLAILPFQVLNDDENNNIYGIGIAIETLTKLSRIRSIAVTSQSSSFQFDEPSPDLETVGARLNVNYVLQGTILKLADTFRLTVTLSDTRNNRQLWAETFDRPDKDFLRVQDEMSDAIKVELSSELEKLGIARISTVERLAAKDIDPAALELFFRAQAIKNKADSQDEYYQNIIDRRDMLKTVVAMEPSFFDGIVALFNAEISVNRHDNSNDYDDVEAALEKLEKIAPESGELYAAYSRYYRDTQKLKESVEAAEKAVKINPNLYGVWSDLHRTYALSGRWQQSFDAAEQAFKLDPASQQTRFLKGKILVYQGKYNEFEQLQAENKFFPWYTVRFPGMADSYYHFVSGQLDEIVADAHRFLNWGDISDPKTYQYGVGSVYFAIRSTMSAYTLDAPELAETLSFGLVPYIGHVYNEEYEKAEVILEEWLKYNSREKKMEDRIGTYGVQGAHLFISYVQAMSQQHKWEELVTVADDMKWQANLFPPPLFFQIVRPAPEVDMALAYRNAGQTGKADKMLESLAEQFQSRIDAGFVMPQFYYDYGRTLILKGDTAQGIDYFEKAVDTGWRYFYTARDPAFESVRDDQRFIAILEKHDQDIQKQAEGLSALIAERGLSIPEVALKVSQELRDKPDMFEYFMKHY